MSRKTIFSIIILLYFLIPTGSAFGQVQDSLLIIYQERSFFADRRDTLLAIETLLGHYQTKIETVHINQLKGISIEAYDYVMVMALDRFIEESFLYDLLLEYRGKIIWLGQGVGPLLEAGSYSLTFLGKSFDLLTVTYKKGQTGRERTFPIGVRREFYKVLPTSERAKVYAWLSNGKDHFPFIVKDRNLYYISRVDLNEPLFYIFADFLSDLFMRKNYREEVILVSIEDVHIFRDYNNLQAIADYLYSESIPFLIGLIPYVRQEKSNHITKFTDVKPFLQLLHYMQDRGGRVILHALPLSIIQGTFLVEEQYQLVEEEIRDLKYFLQKAIAECVQNGIYPLGIEAPYVHLKEESFQILKEHFSSFFGMISIVAHHYVIFPYEIYDSHQFNTFYPFNIGYMDPEDRGFWLMDEKYQKIELVRGFMAGVYFHSYLPIEELHQLVEYLLEKGIGFYDILQDDHWVKTREYEMYFTGEGLEIITLQEAMQSSGLYFSFTRISTFIQWFLSLVFLLFLIIFTRSYRNFKKSLIRGWRTCLSLMPSFFSPC